MEPFPTLTPAATFRKRPPGRRSTPAGRGGAVRQHQLCCEDPRCTAVRHAFSRPRPQPTRLLSGAPASTVAHPPPQKRTRLLSGAPASSVVHPPPQWRTRLLSGAHSLTRCPLTSCPLTRCPLTRCPLTRCPLTWCSLCPMIVRCRPGRCCSPLPTHTQAGRQTGRQALGGEHSHTGGEAGRPSVMNNVTWAGGRS